MNENRVKPKIMRNKMIRSNKNESENNSLYPESTYSGLISNPKLQIGRFMKFMANKLIRKPKKRSILNFSFKNED